MKTIDQVLAEIDRRLNYRLKEFPQMQRFELESLKSFILSGEECEQDIYTEKESDNRYGCKHQFVGEPLTHRVVCKKCGSECDHSWAYTLAYYPKGEDKNIARCLKCGAIR
jgi:hypothetical protein